MEIMKELSKVKLVEDKIVHVEHLDGKEIKNMKFYERASVEEALSLRIGEVKKGVFMVIKNG